jgi:hypothetical protein
VSLSLAPILFHKWRSVGAQIYIFCVLIATCFDSFPVRTSAPPAATREIHRSIAQFDELSFCEKLAESDWSSVWEDLGYLPPYLHICCIGGVFVALISGLYHAVLLEGIAAIDCSMAISLSFAVLMTSLGIPFWYQLSVLLPCILAFIYFWRQGNPLALFLGGVGCPFNIWNCAIRGWYLGALSMIFMFLGIGCFLADRLKKYPLHFLWHIFSAASIFCTLLAVVYDGPALETFRSRPWW